MKSVGAYDAKTHLPRLLLEVERGETIEITRHGRPVARLVPIQGISRTPEEAVDALRALPKLPLPDGLTLRDLIEEGRRF